MVSIRLRGFVGDYVAFGIRFLLVRRAGLGFLLIPLTSVLELFFMENNQKLTKAESSIG
jgi:hypothetical protein